MAGGDDLPRPEIQGLKYFPFDVGFFRDRKIRLLRGEHGADGVEVYQRLVCRCYEEDNGYFLLWDSDEDHALLADETGYSEDKIRLIVSSCLRRSLFDDTLFKMGNVLTSRGIQRRYFSAIKDTKIKAAAQGRYTYIYKDLCLLTEKDFSELNKTQAWLKVAQNYLISRNNHDKSEKNPDKSEKNPLNEMKGNETRLNEMKGEDTIPPLSPQGGTDDPPPSPDKTGSVPYTKIMDMYNRICGSFPKIKIVDGARKKAVGARFKTYGDIAVFQTLFEKTEASLFLKGDNDRNWRADFDWIIKPTNMAKVLEGKYDNDRWATRPGQGSQRSGNPFLDIAKEKGYIKDE